MPTTEDNMIATATIPMNPSVLDFADAEGKIVLWVKDEEEGRSVYMGVKMYGEIDRVYEVQYDAFERVITKMMGDVIMYNADDPFTKLLMGAENAS